MAATTLPARPLLPPLSRRVQLDALTILCTVLLAVVAFVVLYPVLLLAMLAGGHPWAARAGTTTATLKIPWSPESINGDHQITQAEAVDDAQQFTVILANQRTYKGYLSQMKAANPSVVLA